MTNIGGPKKPNDPPKGVGGKVLSFPKVEKREPVVNVPDIKAESPPEKALTVQTQQQPAEGFDPNASKGTQLPERVPIELRGGNVKARLAALGQLPIKT